MENRKKKNKYDSSDDSEDDIGRHRHRDSSPEPTRRYRKDSTDESVGNKPSTRRTHYSDSDDHDNTTERRQEQTRRRYDESDDSDNRRNTRERDNPSKESMVRHDSSDEDHAKPQKGRSHLDGRKHNRHDSSSDEERYVDRPRSSHGQRGLDDTARDNNREHYGSGTNKERKDEGENVRQEKANVWRKGQTFKPETCDKLHEHLSLFKPYDDLLTSVRVLIIGHVGAGKSSFVNSVNCAMRGRNEPIVYTQDTSGKSVTTVYRGFQLRNKKGEKIPMILCDSMGIEVKDGLVMDDVSDILDGKFKDGSKLDRAARNYKQGDKELLDQMIQLVLFVMDSSKIEMFSKEITEQMQQVKKKAEERDILCALLLTKVDERLGPELDVTTIYELDETHSLAESASSKVGVGVNDVFFSINYDTFAEPEEKKDILILRCVQQMQNLCNMTLRTKQERIETQKEKEKKEKHAAEEKLQPLKEAVRNPWGQSMEQYLHFIEEFDTGYANVPHIKILQVGQIGTGKSSFINSVESMCRGRPRQIVKVQRKASTVTRKLTEIEFAYGDHDLNFTIQDTMGLEEGKKGEGILYKDLEKLLDGKIAENYAFSSRSTIAKDDKRFIRKPQPSQQPIVLALFMDCNQVETMPERVRDVLRDLIDQANEDEIGVAVILTKIDLLDEKIGEDIKAADKHRKLKEIISIVHEMYGISETDICYVKNYTNELDTKEDLNTLVASVIRRLLHLGQDSLDRMARDGTRKLQKKKGKKNQNQEDFDDENLGKKRGIKEKCGQDTDEDSDEPKGGKGRQDRERFEDNKRGGKQRHDDSDDNRRGKGRKQRHDDSDDSDDNRRGKGRKQRHDDSDDSDDNRRGKGRKQRHDDSDDSDDIRRGKGRKQRHDDSDDNRRGKGRKQRHDDSDDSDDNRRGKEGKQRHDDSDDSDDNRRGKGRKQRHDDSDDNRRGKGGKQRRDDSDDSDDNRRGNGRKQRYDDSDDSDDAKRGRGGKQRYADDDDSDDYRRDRGGKQRQRNSEDEDSDSPPRRETGKGKKKKDNTQGKKRYEDERDEYSARQEHQRQTHGMYSRPQGQGMGQMPQGQGMGQGQHPGYQQGFPPGYYPQGFPQQGMPQGFPPQGFNPQQGMHPPPGGQHPPQANK